MGLINSALLIDRSALLSYQSALQVVGNNVSNAGNPDYTRQTAILRPQVGVELPGGLIPGGGVALTDLQRNIDESVENVPFWRPAPLAMMKKSSCCPPSIVPRSTKSPASSGLP